MSPQRQLKATPVGNLSFSVPIMSILQFQSLSKPAGDNNNKNKCFLSCQFPFPLSILNWFSRSLPIQGILCSWKNNLNDKLQTGLLRSSLFLAHLYQNLIQKKKIGRNTNSIRCMRPGQTLCHVAFTPRHDRPGELHEVINEDGPGPFLVVV